MNDHSVALSDDEIAAMFAEGEWAKRFPPTLTLELASELLHTPAKTIRDWRSRGYLAGCVVKPGKHLIFLRDRLIRRIFCEWRTMRNGERK
jgi:hypothetical protein